MIIKLREIGLKGLVKDIVPHEAPDGYVTEAENVRFTARGILRMPRPTPLYTAPAGAAVIASVDRVGSGARVFAAGAGDLWISNGDGTFANAGTDYDGTAEEWEPEAYGHMMIFCGPSNVPQFCDESEVTFSDMTAWPASTRARLIRGYKSFLVAVGLIEDAVEKNNVIMWSDAAYNNQLPPNWDYNDPASFSGQATVGTEDGHLVDAAVMGDQLILYCEHGAHSMQFVGGSFVMQFRELFKYGLINRGAVGIFDRMHFCVGRNVIYVHDGVNVKRVAEARVERAIYSDIADPSTVQVAVNKAVNEIVIKFRSQSKNITVGWVWNYLYDTWTRMDMPDATYLWYGQKESQSYTWDDAETAEPQPQWSGIPGIWSEYTINAEIALMQLGGGVISEVYGDYESDDRMPYMKSRIQRVGIDLDAMGEFNSRTLKFIRRIYPIMAGEDTAQVRWRFGSSQSPDSTITWRPWTDYNVRDGVKVDTRVTGRYLAFEMIAYASQRGGWALTGLDIDVEPAGGR